MRIAKKLWEGVSEATLTIAGIAVIIFVAVYVHEHVSCLNIPGIYACAIH